MVEESALGLCDPVENPPPPGGLGFAVFVTNGVWAAQAELVGTPDGVQYAQDLIEAAGNEIRNRLIRGGGEHNKGGREGGWGWAEEDERMSGVWGRNAGQRREIWTGKGRGEKGRAVEISVVGGAIHDRGGRREGGSVYGDVEDPGQEGGGGGGNGERGCCAPLDAFDM